MDETPVVNETEDTDQTVTEPPQSDVPADQTQPDPDDSQAVDVAALSAERDALALQVIRLEIAAEVGVPADLLSGDNPDQVRAQAEKLVAYAASRRVPDFGGGRRGEEITPPDPDPLRKALGR